MGDLLAPQQGVDVHRDAVAYRERLRVPVRWWLQGGLMVSTFWLVMIVAIPAYLAWALTGPVLFFVALGLISYGNARVEVTDDEVRVGRARIAHGFVGSVDALDRAEMRNVSGPAADVRAFLLLRPYLDRGVRIRIDDPADPTPYWLVSSRKPAALAAAIASARQPADTRDR